MTNIQYHDAIGGQVLGQLDVDYDPSIIPHPDTITLAAPLPSHITAKGAPVDIKIGAQVMKVTGWDVTETILDIELDAQFVDVLHAAGADVLLEIAASTLELQRDQPYLVHTVTADLPNAALGVLDSDARLTDDRDPTLHGEEHKHGGSDPVATGTPAAWQIPEADNDGKLDAGWIRGGLTLIERKSPTAVGTVTFSSIPATYKSLKLLFSLRGTDTSGAQAVRMRFNADTGSNYLWALAKLSGLAYAGEEASGSGAGTPETSLKVGSVPDADLADWATVGELVIPDYLGAFFKGFSRQGWEITAESTGTFCAVSAAGQWKDTDAITSLTVFLAAGNFADGSQLDLYGIG